MARSAAGRRIGVIGRLGVHPLVQLSLPSRRVLVYLALHGTTAARPLVAERLWPDLPEPQGRANLRRALWQLPPGWVRTGGDDLVLDADVDLEAARTVAAAAIQGAPLTLDQIALLSEDLLPGWHEEWLVAAQDAFHLTRVQALEGACRTLTAAGEHAAATQAGAAALAAEPLRESAAAALIDALLREGNRFEAARRYRAFARLLADELGVEPDPELTSRLGPLAGTG